MKKANGYEPGFDICLEAGEAGESVLAGLLRCRDGDKFEVKRDARAFETGRLYVEFACQGRDGEWRPSGIATTASRWWAYVLGDTGVVIVFNVETLKYMARQQGRAGRHAEHREGENPTKGVLVALASLPSAAAHVPFPEMWERC